ncbi:MAG: hypothetical protein J0L92_33965 [Deltaproteobacteria bacterium]|nr:hypothetical protein [Deltaproteobacteria bacterium]
MLARSAPFALFALLATLAGCGTPELGEPCSGSPQLGGCVEGTYCVEDDGPVRGDDEDVTWQTFTCRASCTRQADCAADEYCEAVPGTPTLSACQPRSTP